MADDEEISWNWVGEVLSFLDSWAVAHDEQGLPSHATEARELAEALRGQLPTRRRRERARGFARRYFVEGVVTGDVLPLNGPLAVRQRRALLQAGDCIRTLDTVARVKAQLAATPLAQASLERALTLSFGGLVRAIGCFADLSSVERRSAAEGYAKTMLQKPEVRWALGHKGDQLDHWWVGQNTAACFLVAEICERLGVAGASIDTLRSRLYKNP